MKYFKLFICLLLLTSGFFEASAQLDNNTLRYTLPMNIEDTNKLLFNFNNNNFLRNTEYFGTIERGQTMFGYQLNPTLSYMPSKFVRFEAGGFIRKDFGNDLYTKIDPTFTLKLQKGAISVLMGTLEGNLNHRLIEPLYSVDRLINFPIENGLQLKINHKRIWADTWIQWEKMEYQSSPYKEHIWTGHSSVTTLTNPDKKFKIQVPLQAVIWHEGGQLDTLVSKPLTSLLNATGGLRFSYLMPNAFITEIRSDNYLVAYKDLSPTKLQRYRYNSITMKEGTGVMLNLLIKSKLGLDFMVSYWDVNNYVAPHGGPLYQSVSSAPQWSYQVIRQRKLLFLRLMYEKQIIPNLFLNVRFEPFRDFTDNRNLDFSYSIYFTYRKTFSLLKHVK